MAKLSDTQYSYTQSFLQQLQTEWREFWFEVGHHEPCEVTEFNSNKFDAKQKDLGENLVDSLNKFNTTSGGNIVIPVPLKTLKRLLSPSKCNADEVFKIELLNEIKENLNLTSVTCKKLQKLLLPNESLEVSDFPTPSILTNHRNSAPARLLNKKKIKSKQLVDNELFKITDNFRNKENLPNQQLLIKDNENVDKNKKLDNLMRSIIDSSDDENNVNILSARRNILQNNNKNVPTRIKNTLEKPNDADKRKLLSIKKTKRMRNLRECHAKENDAEKQQRYSSVYDLQVDARDSSNLFVTGKSQKKNGKPTIVCTYFSQAELGKIYQIVKKLGFFEIENNVSAKTTHLICGSSKKTVNLCKAVARGCWILDKEWVSSSSAEGRWLYEERFEKYELSAAIKENRMKRQKYGPVYRCNIFTECGSIYVSKHCDHPKTEDIKEIIMLGGGHLTDNVEKAKFIIGRVPQRECLKETWILSCIMQGRVLNITNQFIKI